MSISGELSHELEVDASANKAWELYGTLKMARLVEQVAKDVLEKIDLVEGDGGVGTCLKLTFTPGGPLTYYVEKFTKIDDEERVKELEIVEGGYLEMGFILYGIRFQMLEKVDCPSSCIIKSTIFYQLKEEDAANASLVNTDFVATIAEIVKEFLLENKS